ncbi:hypothetical protein [Butyrivibrio sp. NC2002]|uniref:hypothetical protein n=1 Tax=Butyrivibrio sp. NC2002 TaxID=1410610 RepID=UPI00055F8AA3|nr:hypothetical protein [Butyrivibrio sp. NC2002]
MKKIVSYILFFVILITSVVMADRLLSENSEHGIKQARAMYKQKDDTIDLLFMGASHVHCGVNTAMLWEKYGISAFDYTAAEQTMWQSYYYLQEACKHQKPKVVVMDFYAPCAFTDDYQYDFLYENLQGLRFGKNKMGLFFASMTPDRYDDYFPDFVSYHNRYEELTEDDFNKMIGNEDLESFKGYAPHFRVNKQKPEDCDTDIVGSLPKKTEEYLEKIINFCEKRDIKLYFMVVPYVVLENEQENYNRVGEIAAQHGIDFRNFYYEMDEMGLNFDEHFHDHSHLNHYGSCIFTEYLGKILYEKYGDILPDHRTDKRYDSWNRHVEDINNRVEKGLSGTVDLAS